MQKIKKDMRIDQLAGRSLETLLSEHEDFLWKDYQPFIDAYVYDAEYGGFMCHTDYNGSQLNTHKRTWFDGRGVWVYSFLYQYIKKDDRFLDMARKTLNLLEKARPDAQHLWPWTYDRKGLPLEEPGDIYGNLFVAEGMAAYASASGDMTYWTRARKLLLDAARLYALPAYRYRLLYTPDTSMPEAERVLGHSMIMLRIATAMLRTRPDEAIAQLADDCVQALTEKFFNPKFKLMNEVMNRDYTLGHETMAQFVYIGHAIESLWMLMDEALRREDRALFDLAAERFKFHVEVAWDDVYGGVFHCIDHVEANHWLLEKVLWAQQEVLIGLMMLIQHRQDPWAVRWYDRVYNYVQESFTLTSRNYPIWKIGGNRQVDFPGEGERIENYHHPRHLMLNMRALEALLKQTKQTDTPVEYKSNN